jgi:hypothetical protein
LVSCRESARVPWAREAFFFLWKKEVWRWNKDDESEGEVPLEIVPYRHCFPCTVLVLGKLKVTPGREVRGIADPNKTIINRGI